MTQTLCDKIRQDRPVHRNDGGGRLPRIIDPSPCTRTMIRDIGADEA